MKWTYGDSVQTSVADESGGLVVKPGAVVGITVVEDVRQSRVFAFPPGTVLYTVEFSDGSDALIPESALLPMTLSES
jgi:hypothetical protein